jgi:hypothetical protein
LINWLLVIPHRLWFFVLFLGVGVVSFLGWFAIVFTGRIPDSWTDYVMGVLRYQWRTDAYLLAWSEPYPRFTPPAGYIDPGDYPAVLYCARPLTRNRVTVLFRAFLVIPHYILLSFVALAAFAVLVVAWFAVVITGRWPERMRRFAVGWLRWAARVEAYYFLVTDAYPPFSFEA